MSLYLLQSYEPKHYYMEVVLLIYKLIMSAVVVMFLPETVAQVCVIESPDWLPTGSAA